MDKIGKRQALYHHKKKLDKCIDLPRLCFFKNGSSSNPATATAAASASAFVAKSASAADEAQFYASLVLVAKEGTCEELERALGLDPAQDIVGETLEDLDTPRTLHGLIHRLVEEDYADTSIPSLPLAHKLKTLRPMLVEPQRSKRLLAKQQQARYKETSDSSGNEPTSETKEECRLVVMLQITAKSPVNKFVIDVMEVTCPADDETGITIANTKSYRVDGEDICSSRVDGSVRIDGHIAVHVEVKAADMTEKEKERLFQQVGIEFITLISATLPRFRYYFKGKDGIYRYVIESLALS
ncbi:hypothetical protein VHEMI01569 [[Torrubiella] hemipterigena]|uniref:Uncharacterized protein n=1 Tax=[Torrubiella] hemipterigena TaxID=1531966 RepID=A0A0A1T555_9HYPO|nr:hypothetical protein VHEMI01569 [[Torrubiella] hemipterigena]